MSSILRHTSVTNVTGHRRISASSVVCSANNGYDSSRINFQSSRDGAQLRTVTPPDSAKLGTFPGLSQRRSQYPATEPAMPVENLSLDLFEQAMAPLDRRDVSRTVRAVVLAGGESDNPLARHRAMPSVPIASCLTLVDIPINNCLRSGINKIYVLTQFQSHSLNSHLAASYPPIRLPGPNGAAWVDVLAAQQTNSSREWYKGSADAIRKNIFELKDEARGVDPATDYVILSGAAIYNLDVGKLLAYHRARGADITMCTHLVDENVAPTKGIVKVHQSSGRILKFEEKPSSSRLTSLQREAMEAHGINGVNGTTTPKRKQGGSQYLANMGIYVFRRDALFELLSDAKASAITHIGHHIIPTALAQGLRVHGFQHNGYWQDVSTLRDYYEANLALAGLESPIKMFDVDGAVMGSPRGRLLPPTVMQGEVSVNNSLLDDGTVLVDCSVDNCVVGQCLYIGRGSIAENSLLLGSPYWTSDTIRSEAIARGERVYGVGENCVLRNCILDENVTINDGVQIINAHGVKEADRSDTEGYMIQDGIVVIMRNAVIPAGTVI